MTYSARLLIWSADFADIEALQAGGRWDTAGQVLADATAERSRANGQVRVGLLGTRFTMEEAFYRDRLTGHGLQVLTPDAGDRDQVHRIIYDELVGGVVTDVSRERYVEVAGRLVDAGAQAVIAGCTEIELLLRPDDLPVPLYATTQVHVLAAVDWMLDDGHPSST